MAKRLLLREDQLTSAGNPPSGYRWVGYNGATFSEKLSDGDIIKTGNPRPYKVYTALLTQSSGGEITSGTLTIGITYYITDRGSVNWDFTNVGAPNNNVGTYFVATGTTPNIWGDANLSYTGAPVATVLENTIGNINWTRINDGEYRGELNDGFVIGKTTIFITANTSQGSSVLFSIIDTNTIELATSDTTDALVDNLLSETPIEIRVYN